MNGQTNVQVTALATFASVTILWLLGYFLPDLMATAPEMLGELFTGALIFLSGLLFKSDAGIKQIPGTGASPPLVGLLALIVAAVGLSGCATKRPPIESISDAIVVTSADVEIASDTLLSLCGNTVPRGPCRAGAVISQETNARIAQNLTNVVDGVERASNALAADELLDANDEIGRARSLLTIIRAELARLEE